MPNCISATELYDQVYCLVSLLVVPHLIFVLAEVVFGPIKVQTINSISLSFMFSEDLHHILNPPKFFLDADVLLAGRLRLGVHRRHKHVHKSPNIICRLTLGIVDTGKSRRARETDV